MRVLGCAVLLIALTGCPKPPPPLHKSKDLIESPSTEDINPTWSVALPSNLREVRLHAHTDCVFVTGEKSTSASTRAQLCVSPRTGDVIWAHEIDIATTARRDEDVYYTTAEHLIYANRQQIIGLRRADGHRDWTFEPPGGLPIYSTIGQGEQLVVSLGNRKLAVIDARDGTWSSGFALVDESLKQVITTASGDKIALMVSVDTASNAPPSLVAIDLERPGGADPKGELPAATHLWSTPIESWTGDVSAAGDVILGAFTEGEWWALDAGSGERLWTVRESALQSRPIVTDTAVLLHHHTEAATTKRPKVGILEMISVDPRTLPDQTARWTLTLNTGERLLGVEEIENDPRTLGATTDTLFQFDSKTGRLLWSFTLDRKQDPGQWTNASSNGEAVFLYFETPGKPGNLKRVPIFIE